MLGIKASLGYNEVVGAQLHTETTGKSVNRATAPGLIRNLHLNAQGRVILAFSKLGGAIDGVNVYVQRGDRPVPATMVGRFTHTPAVDATPSRPPPCPKHECIRSSTSSTTRKYASAARR